MKTMSWRPPVAGGSVAPSSGVASAPGGLGGAARHRGAAEPFPGCRPRAEVRPARASAPGRDVASRRSDRPWSHAYAWQADANGQSPWCQPRGCRRGFSLHIRPRPIGVTHDLPPYAPPRCTRRRRGAHRPRFCQRGLVLDRRERQHHAQRARQHPRRRVAHQRQLVVFLRWLRHDRGHHGDRQHRRLVQLAGRGPPARAQPDHERPRRRRPRRGHQGQGVRPLEDRRGPRRRRLQRVGHRRDQLQRRVLRHEDRVQ